MTSRLGFRMPAEWEPHEATWLAWPHEIGLARKIRADSLALWRNRAPPGRVERVRILVRMPRPRKAPAVF